MILFTKRLRLEPIRREHAAVMLPLLVDPRLYTFLPADPPESLAELEKRYAFLEAGKSPDGREHWLNWTIFDRQTGAALGTFQATVRDNAPSDIAYMIATAYWPRGTAREAGTAVIAHVFATYPTPLLAANLDTRNSASIGLVEALGFIRTGIIRDADHFKGSTSDEYRCELLLPAPREA